MVHPLDTSGAELPGGFVPQGFLPGLPPFSCTPLSENLATALISYIHDEDLLIDNISKEMKCTGI
jgi:hypothetical protein